LDQAEHHFAAVAAATTTDDDEQEQGQGQGQGLLGVDNQVQPAPEETTKALNAAFMASARGDWDTAGTILRGLVDSCSPEEASQRDDNSNTYYAVSPSLR
jgi:hypothetical protein